MNLLSGAEIWCPLSVLERLSPYYRGFFKEKIYENFIEIILETVRNREVSVLERCPYREVPMYLGYSVKPLLLHTPPAIFSVIVFILIRFRPSQQTT